MKKYTIFAATLLLIVTVSCNKDYYDESIIRQETNHSPDIFNAASRSESYIGDIQFVKSGIGFYNEKEMQLFEVFAPETNDYYLGLWIMPADGAEYYMVCNDTPVEGKYIPHTEGWQSVYFCSNQGTRIPVPLVKGRNIIGFYSSLDELPEIETINGALDVKDCFIPSFEYDRMMNDIVSGNKPSYYLENSFFKTRSESSVHTPSPYSTAMQYQYELNCPVNYTTTKSVYSSASTTLTVTISSATEAVVVDIYHENSGAITSRLCLPTSSVTFSTTIPQGMTHVHLRRWNHYPEGIATLTLKKGTNASTIYYCCVVSGYNIQMEAPYFSGSLNYFTCCNTNGVDPILFLENGTSDPSPIGYRLDDFPFHGDYIWGKNARILANSATSNIPEAHIFKSASNSPTGTCDVYLGLPFFPDMSGFPDLNYYDAICSGEYSEDYNCIGWAGDLLTYVWPPTMSQFNYNVSNDLESFDNYFAWCGYTRVGANESNAAVALWGYSDSHLTHASIRNNSNSIYPHGYEWESKAGWRSRRLFHPKDALECDTYGTILYYYRPIPTKNHSKAKITIEQIEINSNDKNKLKEVLTTIPENVIKDFNYLFEQWTYVCTLAPLSFVSNPKDLMKCPEYHKLYSFVSNNIDIVLPCIIEKVFEKELFACFLMSEVLPSNYEYLKEISFKRCTEKENVFMPYERDWIRLSSLILNQISN